MSLRLAPVLVAADVVWSAVLLVAPLLGWSLIYGAAHLVCHQIPTRSFYFSGGPVAVCARCLGLYLGAAAGGVFALTLGRSTGTMSGGLARGTLAAAALPTLLTWLGEWLLQWPVGNAMRFMAALPLGAAAAWLVVRALEVDWRA